MIAEREIASIIIDLVEDAIRANHKPIEKYASRRKGTLQVEKYMSLVSLTVDVSMRLAFGL